MSDAESKKVLVIEDEPYLCDLIADVLEAEGHQPAKAANGLDALAESPRASRSLSCSI